MRYVALVALLLLSGCLKHVLQQGNVLKPDVVSRIEQGDSRFRVENLLGTPVLQDTLHPHKSIYIDDYDDPKTGKKYRRSVTIVYDEAWRVKSIRLSGFDHLKNKGTTDTAN